MKQGICGENLIWTLENDKKTLKIDGYGSMYDFSSDIMPPWHFWRKFIKSVVVQGNITSIGNAAFEFCDTLEEIFIPNTIISIGNAAFYSCDSLKNIFLPKSIVFIGNEAFEFCDSLKSIIIPENVVFIGVEAFDSCIRLEKLTIHDNINYIGVAAFKNCPNLKNIVFSGENLPIHQKIRNSICDLNFYTKNDAEIA